MDFLKKEELKKVKKSIFLYDKPKRDIFNFFSNIPTNLKKLEIIKPLELETSQTYLATDSIREYVVKYEKKIYQGKIVNGYDQLYMEVLADYIYRALGYKTPDSIIKINSEDKAYKLAEYIQGKTLRQLPKAEKEKAIKELKKGYVLDCLLANWDVVGHDESNILVKGDDVYRIDNGGSFYYKPGGKYIDDKFSKEKVTEIKSISFHNPCYFDITEKEIKEQIQYLDANWHKIDKKLYKVVLFGTEMNMLDKRLEYLKKQYIGGVM